MSEQQEKFNKYNSWCQKSSQVPQNNIQSSNFQKNWNGNKSNNFKYRRNEKGSTQEFNPNAYYHASMLEDPWK
jgi:hypothetical protein